MTQTPQLAERSRTLKERFRSVNFLLVDVDGVLTSGDITYSATSQGSDGELKSFHVRDGLALKIWVRQGFRWAVLTGRSSSIVQRRAEELLAFNILQGAVDKLAQFASLLEQKTFNPSEVCYIGDDEPDLGVMRQVGLAVTVADSCPAARQVAHYQTAATGGHGAVREVIERVLRCQGKWHNVG